MADGSAKAIDEIEPGDVVVATDPVTGETGTREVLGTIVGQGRKELDDLTVDTDGTNGDQAEKITATSNRPFWVVVRGWVHAANLHIGDSLVGENADTVEILAVAKRSQYARVYNLTVADLHAYYVLAGNTPVLVHNDGEDDYNQAMKKALAWLEQRGFVAETPTMGKFGTIKGQPIGMQTSDGQTGFRIEFDRRNGAHINVWSGKEKGPYFNFDATESTVKKIQSRFGCR